MNISQAGTASPHPTSNNKPVGRLGKLRTELKKSWHLYLFLLPTFAFVLIFRYYPAGSAVYHAFTKWNGAGTETWVGFIPIGIGSRRARWPVL